MGDEADLRAFYDAHARRVVVFALGLTGDHADAQDLTQEAFARAWSRWSQVSVHPRPEAWVFTVVRRLAANRWRHLSVVRAWERDAPRTTAVHSPAPSPDHVALLTELARLRRPEREVLTLHHLLDLPLAAVADLLAMPLNTVKSHAARGRTRLAAALTDPDDVSRPAEREPQP